MFAQKTNYIYMNWKYVWGMTFIMVFTKHKQETCLDSKYVKNRESWVDGTTYQHILA